MGEFTHMSFQFANLILVIAALATLGLVIVGSFLVRERLMRHKIQFSELCRRAVVDSIYEGVITIDEDGFIISVNSRVQQLFGYAPDVLLAQPITKLVSENERYNNDLYASSESHAIQEIIMKREKREVSARRQDGTVFPAEFTLAEVHLKRKHLFVGMFRDITEQKQLQMHLDYQLVLQADEIAKANMKFDLTLKEKNVLLQEVHHRVSNNFQLIISLLRLQLEYVSDVRLRATFEESENRIRAMALVHRTLYQSENLSQVNAKIYLESLASQLSFAYQGSRDQVALTVTAITAPLSLNKAIPCGLILHELVSNAFKYAFPRSQKCAIFIHFSMTPNQQFILQVRDTGVGLPSNLDPYTSQSLGFRLVRLLVDQLHGSLVFFTRQGTEVTITFAVLDGP